MRQAHACILLYYDRTLRWRHNDNDGVSNHHHHGCLLNVYSDADQRKHQSSASLAFVWGIHRDRWIPRRKGQLRGKCFHLMTSSWNVVQYIENLSRASVQNGVHPHEFVFQKSRAIASNFCEAQTHAGEIRSARAPIIYSISSTMVFFPWWIHKNIGNHSQLVGNYD